MMTFDSFVQTMESIDQNTPNFFLSLFLNPWFSLCVCSLFLLIVSFVMLDHLTNHQADDNVVLRFFRNLYEFEGVTVLIFFAFIFGGIGSTVYVYHHYDSEAVPQREKAYLTYMESQKPIKQNLEEVIWKPEMVSDAKNTRSRSYINQFDIKPSYLYQWASCENCKKQTVFYKIKKTDENYIQMEVFASYTLNDGETPYLLTKPPLRETVGKYSSQALLNPTLYLPKNEWGFAK